MPLNHLLNKRFSLILVLKGQLIVNFFLFFHIDFYNYILHEIILSFSWIYRILIWENILQFDFIVDTQNKYILFIF